MSYSDMDLDINNYNLNELLNLYNLTPDFDAEQLKRAYKQTLMTHPDKSGLDKKFFLFFSKAYKMIKYVYNFKNMNEEEVVDKEYEWSEYLDSKLNSNTNMSKQINKIMKRKDFNKVFNKLFDETKIHDEEQDAGYEDWIKANPINNNNIDLKNTSALNEYINNAKREARELVKYNGVRELDSSLQCGNTSNLLRKKPEYYESNLFSKMPYEDYKRAHTETVVPVTEEDYNNRKQFNNIHEIKAHRHRTEKDIDYSEVEKKIAMQKTKDTKESIEIAFNLSKQMEAIKKSNALFKGKLNLLEG